MKTALCLLLLSALSLASCAQGKPSESVTLKLIPDRNLVFKEPGGEVVLKVDLHARSSRTERRMPINLALVLDHSGSMEGAKIEKARQAACVAISQLSADDIFSLVIFDDSVEVLIPPQKVRNPEALKRIVRRISPGGSTALYAGVQAGASQLRKFLSDDQVNRVILMSDGLANVGPSSPASLAELGRSLHEDGIQVTTIGLGDDYNENLMVALAEASHANYYYVQDSEKLPGIFAEELGCIKNIVARNIRIIIELPDGVTPISIIGHPEISFENRRAEIPLSELYSAQQRSFLIRCRLDKPSRDTQQLADVQINFQDPDFKEVQNVRQKASVQLTDKREASDKSLNAEVLKEAALSRNAETREQALALADAGKAKDASDLLRNQAAVNKSLPAPAQSPELSAATSSLTGAADKLEQNGTFDSTDRKSFQFENYRQKNQKP
ncbi:MAG: VWA domain-containing protein [Methylacidiphilales bacterium]|nr:VWA domain-containing protein [Candidatus Methylacidiphilales bacterium]